jgi:hypothetical protein
LPLHIWQGAQEHTDGLLREFTLIAQGAEARAATPIARSPLGIRRGVPPSRRSMGFLAVTRPSPDDRGWRAAQNGQLGDRLGPAVREEEQRAGALEAGADPLERLRGGQQLPIVGMEPAGSP